MVDKITNIENKSFDEERALYGSRGVRAVECRFDGPADGESAFKESRDIIADRCYFNLRYPFWHDVNVRVTNCELTPMCRAAFWYSEHMLIENSRLHGIKALRECHDVKITESDILSAEFGWSTTNCLIDNSTAEGEYFMLRAEKLKCVGLRMKGKYSFQYIKDSEFSDCILDTKDAFWHCENVVVRDSVVKGEYLAWYSKNLTFINCKISGTQPLCYCKGLKLIDCEFVDADLSFEKSEVEATLTTPVVSVKNPASGFVRAPGFGEIIMDDPEAKAVIEVI